MDLTPRFLQRPRKAIICKPAALRRLTTDSDIWPAAVHDQYGIDAVGLNRPDSWFVVSPHLDGKG